MNRPSFTHTFAALRTNAVTPSEHDLLATVEYVVAEHISAAETKRPDGSWGRCEECGRPWPCPAWVASEAASIEWLISRSSLTARAIREHLKREDRKERA